jgi:hypothetical protein
VYTVTIAYSERPTFGNHDYLEITMDLDFVMATLSLDSINVCSKPPGTFALVLR